MMRSIGISVVAVLMLAQLLMLPSRSMLIWRYGPDLPPMRLPVASEGTPFPAGHAYADLSWTEHGGWVAAGVGVIGAENLEPFLRRVADRCEQAGCVPRVRVRVPANAPAKHFVHLTRCMERVGIPGLRIAVVRPDAPWV
jgi:hypothetical protein